MARCAGWVRFLGSDRGRNRSATGSFCSIPQKLSAGGEQCGALSDGKAEPNELERSSKRGGRSAQLKPTATCQKQKLYCCASSGRVEECASTICTKLAPWRMVKFILRSNRTSYRTPAGREDGSLGDQHPSRRCKPCRKRVSDILLSFHPCGTPAPTPDGAGWCSTDTKTRTSGSVLSKVGGLLNTVLRRVESARFKVSGGNRARGFDCSARISFAILRLLRSTFGTLLAPSRSSIRPSEIRGVYKGIVRLQVPEHAELTRDHFCSMGWNVTAMGRQNAHAHRRWEHDWQNRR
jgi:hypothetical protein